MEESLTNYTNNIIKVSIIAFSTYLEVHVSYQSYHTFSAKVQICNSDSDGTACSKSRKTLISGKLVLEPSQLANSTERTTSAHEDPLLMSC